MWEMARSIARGNSLGDIGVSPTGQPDFETDIESSDPYALLGFLELYVRLQKKQFLKIASRIGDNILSDRFYTGFFVPSKEALYTKFDYVEPLALLHLDAVVNARSGLTTQIWPSRSDFGCQYAGSMKEDNRVIYSQTMRTELLTLLRVAAWAGRVDEVETLISKGVNVNAHCKLDSRILQRIWGAQVGLDTWLEARLTNTTTPLHSAAEKGHKDVAELLIAKGADVNAEGMHGDTPLQYAARYDRKEIIKLLLEKGSTISTIHLAAYMGDVAKLETFTQEGVDINALDSFDYAPLYYAVQNGQKEAAELLIAKGADVNVKNRRGQTPLDIAARRSHKDIAELLITKDADVNSDNLSGETPLYFAARAGNKDIIELLVANGADVNAKKNDGQTPVDIALSRNRNEVVKLLIAKGADVSSVHLAAYIGDLARVKAFIQEGIDVNTRVRGWTPLHYAAREGHMEIVESLLKNGADVNVKEEYYSRTATEIAMGRNHNEIVELLVSKGADIPPLHLAIYLKDEAKARSLIEGGADVNNRTPDGTTPLNRAIGEGLKDIAELLIARGADVNAGYYWGWTPLHGAAEEGRRELAELLIAKGANVNARDGGGRSPLWYAQDQDHTEIVELLRKHGAKE
jgi:ankyrin repeat protein